MIFATAQRSAQRGRKKRPALSQAGGFLVAVQRLRVLPLPPPLDLLDRSVVARDVYARPRVTGLIRHNVVIDAEVLQRQPKQMWELTYNETPMSWSCTYGSGGARLNIAMAPICE